MLPPKMENQMENNTENEDHHLGVDATSGFLGCVKEFKLNGHNWVCRN